MDAGEEGDTGVNSQTARGLAVRIEGALLPGETRRLGAGMVEGEGHGEQWDGGTGRRSHEVCKSNVSLPRAWCGCVVL